VTQQLKAVISVQSMMNIYKKEMLFVGELHRDSV
jgi:hypothetical protein